MTWVTIARIAAPSGHDAEGTLIPLTVAVNGDLIALTVEHQAGQYKFPIEIDPTTYDTQVVDIHNGVTYQSRWKVDTSNGKEGPFYFSESSSYGIRDYHGQGTSPEYQRGEWGGFAYETQGESAIYDVHLGSSFGDEGHGFENRAQIKNKTPTGKNESPLEIRTNSYSEGAWPGWTLCILAECAVPGEVTPEIAENNVSLAQFASQTGNYTMDAELGGAYIYIVQTKNSTVSLDTTDVQIAGVPNALYGTEHWVKGTAAVKGKATDPGIGISEVGFTSPQETKWIDAEAFPYPATAQCEGVICPREQNYAVDLTGLPDGKDTVTFSGQNDTDTKAQAAKTSATVYVDNTPPHSILLSGLPASKEIGGGEYKLTAEATDGTSPTPSSGMKSMALLVDGREVGSLSTPCSPGPCTTHSGTWTIFGHNYATGEHILTVEATDNAGNMSTETITMIVHQATPITLGPASVNPLSGELSLTTTDVSLGGLTVSRSFGSQHLTTGESGPVSAQWGFALGGEEQLLKQPDGSMVLVDTSGGQTIFTTDGKGGYVSPVGDSNLTLSNTPCEAGQSEFMLKDAAAATTTCFKVPVGGSSEVWMPSIVKGAVATSTVTYAFERSAKGIIEPIEALAPVPAGVSCSPTLKAGCRALTFNYAASTTATGEAQSEWGDYAGHLTRVYYTAYDPVSKAMKTVEVARYLYDSHAQLRAEWDPRIEASNDCGKVCPALKTIYGYDSEGHVTSLTLPGQESWVFTYGTIASDASGGRVLKVTQAPVSASLWSGESLKVTEAPKITGTPMVGVRLAVSDGVWSGSPVGYGYQWERCNSTGGECVPISGATNANYTTSESDVSHTLQAVVTATNGGGSVSASAHVLVTGSAISEYVLPSKSQPDGITTGSDGNLWFAENGTSKIGKITTSGAISEYSLPSGSSPFEIVSGSDKNLWFTDNGSSKIGKMTTSGAITEYALPSGSGPRGIVSGPDKNLWFTDDATGKVGKITTAGTITEYALPSGSGPYGITAGSDGNLWFADSSTSKIGKITTSGTITEYALPSGSGPAEITSGPDKNLWFASLSTSKIGKITTAGVVTEYGLSGTVLPVGVASGSDGNVWFTELAGTLGKMTIAGVLTEYALPSGSEPFGITSGPDKNVWFAMAGTNKIGMVPLAGTPGESRTPGPGSTIEYNVPLSGSGLSNLTGAQVEKWAQSDKPTEATALFPPDEPQGWPASSYKRATIYYSDSTSRTVNVVTPSGAISTSEYNEHNDVVRSLSADNRVTALKEANPAEASRLLDTQSEYNSEGNELLSTLGPRHTVKLENGKEVQARTHTVYRYDEGAPEAGGPYRLITRTTQGAQIEGEAEQDVRTTSTLYSGQAGLGWMLRKPTAVTVDPSGLKLTHRTVYDPTTGSVVETRAPGAGGPAPYMHYVSSWGVSGPPYIYKAEGVTVNKEGNVWVADTENNRILELSSGGTLLRTVGSFGSENGQFNKPAGVATDSSGNVWVADTGNSRVQEFSSTGTYIRQTGKAGTSNGEFKSPRGITVDSAGHVWVADTANSRVQELSSEGAYITQYGSKGTGNVQFASPSGVVIDKESNIWVADSGNGRIQELNGLGIYVRQFGREGTTTPCKEEGGKLVCKSGWAEGIAIDASGHIWTTESAKIEEFSSTGTLLGRFGASGHGEGQLESLKGIALDSESHLWLADAGNMRIQRAVLHWLLHSPISGLELGCHAEKPESNDPNQCGQLADLRYG